MSNYEHFEDEDDYDYIRRQKEAKEAEKLAQAIEMQKLAQQQALQYKSQSQNNYESPNFAEIFGYHKRKNQHAKPIQGSGLNKSTPREPNFAEIFGYHKRKNSHAKPIQGSGLSNSTTHEANFAERFGYHKRKNRHAKPVQGFNLGEESYTNDPYSGKELDIPENLTERIKDSFGIDTNEISIVESSEVAKLGAKATAQGNVISFAPSEYQPNTKEGLELLGHELNHIRDQALNKVTANITGTNINIDVAHETNSDRAGKAFASGTLSGATPITVNSASGAPIQRFAILIKAAPPVWKIITNILTTVGIISTSTICAYVTATVIIDNLNPDDLDVIMHEHPNIAIQDVVDSYVQDMINNYGGKTPSGKDNVRVGSGVANVTVGGVGAVVNSVNLKESVGEVLKRKLGKIRNAPLPPGSPTWEAIIPLTMGEVQRRKKRGDIGFGTIWKLLTDQRFNRN